MEGKKEMHINANILKDKEGGWKRRMKREGRRNGEGKGGGGGGKQKIKFKNFNQKRRSDRGRDDPEEEE